MIPVLSGPVMRPRVVAVLCAFNEAETAPGVVRRLLEAGAEVLVVDDDSPDGTAVVVSRFADAGLPVRVAVRAARSFGGALLTGLRLAVRSPSPDFVLQLDADGSHPPEVLDEMLRAACGADLVIASRFVPGGSCALPGGRLAVSRVAALTFRWAAGCGVRDPTSGMRLWRASFLSRLAASRIHCRGFAVQLALLARALRARARVREVPLPYASRTAGASKMRPWMAAEALCVLARAAASAAMGDSTCRCP